MTFNTLSKGLFLPVSSSGNLSRNVFSGCRTIMNQSWILIMTLWRGRRKSIILPPPHSRYAKAFSKNTLGGVRGPGGGFSQLAGGPGYIPKKQTKTPKSTWVSQPKFGGENTKTPQKLSFLAVPPPLLSSNLSALCRKKYPSSSANCPNLISMDAGGLPQRECSYSRYDF